MMLTHGGLGSLVEAIQYKVNAASNFHSLCNALVILGGDSGRSTQHRPKTKYSSRRTTWLRHPSRLGLDLWYHNNSNLHFLSSLLFNFYIKMFATKVLFEHFCDIFVVVEISIF